MKDDTLVRIRGNWLLCNPKLEIHFGAVRSCLSVIIHRDLLRHQKGRPLQLPDQSLVKLSVNEEHHACCVYHLVVLRFQQSFASVEWKYLSISF